MDTEEIDAITHLSKNSIWNKVDDKLLKPLMQRFMEERSSDVQVVYETKDNQYARAAHLIDFFEKIIAEELHHINYLKNRHEEFVKLYGKSASLLEQRQHILNYAKDLGATDAELKKDNAAFLRWFDADAMLDRYVNRTNLAERKIVLCLERLGPLLIYVFKVGGPQADYRKLWQKYSLEKTLKSLFDYDGDYRIIVMTFDYLTKIVSILPEAERTQVIESSILRYVYRCALDRNLNVWVQYQALCLLQLLSFDSFHIAVKQCLEQVGYKDDIFLRRKIVPLLLSNIARNPNLENLLQPIVNDPSPYVRQSLAQHLIQLSNESLLSILPKMTLQDPSTQVRAAALLSLTQLVNHSNLFFSILEIMKETLTKETDVFVSRVALKTVVDAYHVLAKSFPDLAETWISTLTPLVDYMHISANTLTVRRFASETTEQLWCATVPEAKEVYEHLKRLVSNLRQGQQIKLPKELIRRYEAALIGRVMAAMSQHDFGLTISRSNFVLTRGNVFKFKLWRFLYELRHPSPDKRQGFRHTIGRIIKGNIRAPSTILAEMSETKVPGEPLFISTEGGYRPYLPLMDDILSCLTDFRSDVSIYTSEGITTLCAPKNLMSRLKATWVLNVRFAYYAYLRNWDENSQSNPNSFIASLNKLGFTITFKPYDQKTVDPTVARFFPAFGIFSFGEQWNQLKTYFFSAYQNTLSDLTFFILIAIFFITLKHFFVNKKIRQSRKKLPVVIGGWGTRGKSGTERLKAAMFNALGYSLVCKTTGCEAMFLLAHPFGKTHELFLFRPYEKATIWEHAQLMQYASQFNAELFLWECMALRPNYVNLMQHQWVQDDVSTITNTNPDHEDIQGPAGINIPEVISEFIPKGQCLVTTEEEMLPILRQACNELQTELVEVNWLDSGLLTPDVLSRFPYAEHPSNIALVAKLGEKLGIDNDFALKEMADRVVPDLGVLKIFPAAEINKRQLTFVNGMSANERFATLSNWVSMHFDKQDIYQEPSIWISTVVNNRGDRIARSKVFASILVKDISADKHFLIGTNLQGLMGYIQEAWDQFAEHITLWPESSKTNNAEEVLIQFAKRYRISFSSEHVIKRLSAMLVGTGITDGVDDLVSLWNKSDELSKQLSETMASEIANAIMVFHQRNLETLSEYETFLNAVKKTEFKQREEMDQRFRKLLALWFKQKIYVIEDPEATGNQIINHIMSNTPPGIKNKVMGIQNIKGTGLDFVYQWQTWNSCYQICQKLFHKKSAIIEQGLRELGSFGNFNLLCIEYVTNIVSELKKLPLAQKGWCQVEIKKITTDLELARKKIQDDVTIVRHKGWLKQIHAGFKSILDINVAIRRRKKAEQIYKDILTERISIQRAINELKKLNKAQEK